MRVESYAQAVTFGLLMARAKKIDLATGMSSVSDELSKTSTLIGAALQLLTGKETRQALKTALGTLTRVLDAVDWTKISKDKPEAWLYFYEDFLEVYDNELRKQPNLSREMPGRVIVRAFGFGRAKLPFWRRWDGGKVYSQEQSRILV